MQKHFKVVIIGAGAGGISLAAKLSRSLPEGSIALIDPAEHHYYQPLWSIVGAGLADMKDTQKNNKDLIPQGVVWIKNAVKEILPHENKLLISDEAIQYDYLVVAPGLRLCWDKIEGLGDNLGKNGICSVYQADQVNLAREMITNFKKGNALFVMPPVPIKCAGAPQKIMYLAENVFRNNKVRDKITISWATAGKAMFGIPTFSKPLQELVTQKNIKTYFQHKIIGVDPLKKLAHFEVTDNEGQVTKQSLPYDLLHLVPPMAAPKFIEDSELSFQEGDQKGWLAVDKHTLQHVNFKNIFGLGDVTGIPNSKTGAAVRKQYPVVALNLLAMIDGTPLAAQYDGYSSCPLITEIGKVMLAEFGYDGKLMPTFPLAPDVPRRSMWYLKKDLLPILYWKVMLKGRG
ncbi:MAG: NAD(P)/FAD-dependent oxidoreductase [Bacteriovoracaceae bacterium]|nr:NAD(P)/FAD-dependent oxidoreductase [Bacteriovoracaceae bacterium]